MKSKEHEFIIQLTSMSVLYIDRENVEELITDYLSKDDCIHEPLLQETIDRGLKYTKQRLLKILKENR